ncbi:MAG: type II secretion system secretin GspD [Gammaproteobacteria bacterium]|nr:type II secretion system secretin GspD [Gammaproteobacteria bacterium]
MLVKKNRWCSALLLISCVALLFINSVAAKQVTLNLKKTDIHALIETVAEVTGKNFVVDPRVNGLVTVISAKEIDEKVLYQVFLSVLQVHGFAVVNLGTVIKILPEGNALQGPINLTDKAELRVSDELVTRIIQLEHIAPKSLLPIIRPLMPQQAMIATPPNSNLLLITDRAANVIRISEIIKKIDLPQTTEVEVIRLEHAMANDVASLIQQLRRKTMDSSNGQRIAADQRSNSLLLTGDVSQRLQLRSLIAHLDTPIENSGNTQVIFLKYANAKNLAALLTEISNSKQIGGQPPGIGGHANKVSIQADETTNALIITAATPRFEELRRIISQLDLRRAQVLVEAIIAEVNSDFLRELGAEGFFTRVLGNNTLGPGISSLGSGALSEVIRNTTTADQGGQGLTLDLANLSGKNRWGLLIKALEGNSSTNILSTPTIVTLDNHEANFVVAQNVPFVTGQYTNSGEGNDSVNPFQTIQRENVGLTLKITPQINDGSSIRLAIEQESSSISNSSVATDLITNERKITTSVIVDDDEILVLGGLNQNNETETVTRTPLLGSIPLLGRLFQTTGKTKSKQILMVFIHPVILRDASHRELQTNAKYRLLREEQDRSKEKDRGLTSRELTRLPEFNTADKTERVQAQEKRPEDTAKQSTNKSSNKRRIHGLAGYRLIQ